MAPPPRRRGLCVADHSGVRGRRVRQGRSRPTRFDTGLPQHPGGRAALRPARHGWGAAEDPAPPPPHPLMTLPPALSGSVGGSGLARSRLLRARVSGTGSGRGEPAAPRQPARLVPHRHSRTAPSEGAPTGAFRAPRCADARRAPQEPRIRLRKPRDRRRAKEDPHRRSSPRWRVRRPRRHSRTGTTPLPRVSSSGCPSRSTLLRLEHARLVTVRWPLNGHVPLSWGRRLSPARRGTLAGAGDGPDPLTAGLRTRPSSLIGFSCRDCPTS